MRDTPISNVPTSHVMALFTDAKISFSFLDGSTFADLADSVAELCERYADMPTGVAFRMTAANNPASALYSGT